MKLLLDTHALLWWLDDPGLLSVEARRAIARGDNAVFVSAAAAWEIAIKTAMGRLQAPENLEEVMAAERFEPLPITLAHALAVGGLPTIHQDPFDRIQIAQAGHENLTMVTRDPLIQQYPISSIAA